MSTTNRHIYSLDLPSLFLNIQLWSFSPFCYLLYAYEIKLSYIIEQFMYVFFSSLLRGIKRVVLGKWVVGWGITMKKVALLW